MIAGVENAPAFSIGKNGATAIAFRMRIYRGDNLQIYFSTLIIAIKLRIEGKARGCAQGKHTGFYIYL